MPTSSNRPARGTAAWKARDKRLQAQFNITADEWEVVLAYQKGLCPICLENEIQSGPNKGNEKIWNTDHDHKTGQTRGILCNYCNGKVGEFFTRERVERLYAYFTKPPVTMALGEPRFGRKGRVTNKRPVRRRRTTRTTKRK